MAETGRQDNVNAKSSRISASDIKGQTMRPKISQKARKAQKAVSRGNKKANKKTAKLNCLRNDPDAMEISRGTEEKLTSSDFVTEPEEPQNTPDRNAPRLDQATDTQANATLKCLSPACEYYT